MCLRNYSETLFWKVKIDYISGSIVSGFIQFVFIVCQVDSYQNTLKLRFRSLGFASYKVFLRNKRRSKTSLPSSFFAWFLKKNMSLVTFYKLTKFHCLIAFTSWDIGQYVYCNCLLIRLWRHKSSFFQKVKTKI